MPEDRNPQPSRPEHYRRTLVEPPPQEYPSATMAGEVPGPRQTMREGVEAEDELSTETPPSGPFNANRAPVANRVGGAERAGRPSAPADVAPPRPGGSGDVLRYRPVGRPPTARLFVYDDSGRDAEVIRLRHDRFRIGRAEGDLVIPHDGQMSGSHVEISRQQRGQSWVWRVTDLESTNGTFVRVNDAPLRPPCELVLGGCLYRFQLAPIAERPPPSTMKFTSLPGGLARSGNTSCLAELVEVVASETGRVWRIMERELRIGRTPQEGVVGLEDPMVSEDEARLRCDVAGGWSIQRADSLNGIWLRVATIAVRVQGMQFQCGEQRFEIRLDG